MKKRGSVNFISLFAPIGCAALICFASSINGHSLPDINKYSFDKIAHFIEYLIFGYLTINAVSRVMSRMGVVTHFLIVLVIVLLFGASDEFHQLFVPGRSCNYLDFIFDFIGAGVGILIYAYRVEEKESTRSFIDKKLRSA